MRQRNMPCTSQMMDLEMNQQGHSYLGPEPSNMLGGITNLSQPNVHTNTIVTASGNTANVDTHHLPEHYDHDIFYGMTHYNGAQLHHLAASPDLGVATASNFYYPYMNPSSGARTHVPVNHGAADQLPAFCNYGAIGVSIDEHGRNSQVMDGLSHSFKRKDAIAIPGNFQYSNASTSSSSLIASSNTRHSDGFNGIDAASFTVPMYRGNDTSFMEGGSDRSVNACHSYNQLIQGNYVHQPFHSAGPLWSDQRLSTNCGDGSTTAWNRVPTMPYIHGSSVNRGFIESGNIGVPGYHEMASNRSPSSFLHHIPTNQQGYSFHHLSLPSPGLGGHNRAFHPYPQVAAPSYRVSANNASRSSLDPFQDGMEMGPRHPGPVPPTGFRIYRPHQARVVPLTVPRYRNLPHLRVLPADEVAILDFPEFYEEGDFIDHHMDMRLDIEDMSYEELLALGERIGNVSTGLSEEIIKSKLKTRKYLSSSTSINLEEASSVDQEADSCIICQADYKNQEKIGTLGCGHEYHADCLKKWLLVKNVCPICKSEALTIERKDP